MGKKKQKTQKGKKRPWTFFKFPSWKDTAKPQQKTTDKK